MVSGANLTLSEVRSEENKQHPAIQAITELKMKKGASAEELVEEDAKEDH